MAERVGETDIGLAKLDGGILFSNRFLDIDASAKTLLLLEDISQHGPAIRREVINVSPTRQQELHHLLVAVPHGNHERRPAFGSNGVPVRA